MIVTETGTITPETRAEIIFYGWEVYRRSQQIPWPMVGGKTLLMAQSRLWHAAEPYASGRDDIREANLSLIQLATADLIEAVRAYCGDSAKASVSGQDGSVAA